MTYNPDIHHRNSVRLRSYDYRSAGAYFVTICTFQKEAILAEIVDGVAHLKAPGEIVQDEWLKSAEIRPEIELDKFIIMPNHLHGIVFINDSVGAHGMRPESGGFEMRAHSRAPLHRGAKSLGSFIAGFKSACTKRINESRNTAGVPVWQRNYHERIIRNEEELHSLRDYILTNPVRWDEGATTSNIVTISL
jgi:REP element-mobilizing transposase RayT